MPSGRIPPSRGINQRYGSFFLSWTAICSAMVFPLLDIEDYLGLPAPILFFYLQQMIGHGLYRGLEVMMTLPELFSSGHPFKASLFDLGECTIAKEQLFHLVQIEEFSEPGRPQLLFARPVDSDPPPSLLQTGVEGLGWLILRAIPHGGIASHRR